MERDVGHIGAKSVFGGLSHGEIFEVVICEVRCPHPPRVLDHFHIFLSKFLSIQLQQPLGDF